MKLTGVAKTKTSQTSFVGVAVLIGVLTWEGRESEPFGLLTRSDACGLMD